jgi:hypothetical protein
MNYNIVEITKQLKKFDGVIKVGCWNNPRLVTKVLENGNVICNYIDDYELSPSELMLVESIK